MIEALSFLPITSIHVIYVSEEKGSLALGADKSLVLKKPRDQILMKTESGIVL